MANQLVVEGRVIKADWKNATEETLVVQGVAVEKAEGKLKAIKSGGEKATSAPLFPPKRACQDAIWIVLFLVFGIAIFAYGASQVHKAMDEHLDEPELKHTVSSHEHVHVDDIELPSVSSFLAMVLACFATAVASSFGFIKLAQLQPACVVWTSLIVGPVMGMAMGLAIAAAGAMNGNMMLLIVGFIVLLASTCSLCCSIYWAQTYGPFMIKMTEVVSDVIRDHPCCMGVGIMGSVMAFLWAVAVALSFASIVLANPDLVSKDNSVGRYSTVFVLALALSWGGQVTNNICHVAYCGVFGRWYFGGQDDSSDSDVDAIAPTLGKGTPNTLGPSLTVALTTSLGSICCGSFLVAFIRGLEQVANQMSRDAQSSGNTVGCILAAILKCFISCIGDMLEYFNDWAYVQCAIRGVSFFDAASITLTMMTCANIKYIIADLLLNSLVSCGALLAAALCTAVTAGLGLALGGASTAAIGAIIGLFIGLLSGAAALGVINSGVKTILACWAEDPTALMQTHQDIHDEFVSRILNGIRAQQEQE
mmetsp:Transcript_91175/g.162337  ORF Transcript_91175/g.162337 Transcript_91175/m.162337 type:complete len:535 (-) Transcript_91175:190-1794(-)|eukprot:CAMPEP_0197652126 /NCGR_PEP_ID=MMETSP1338-20131121/34254_1 /TAXON_ID=43686 ORGANISM="Pelagodinium beii, Strain RCC1491" /NCGR_SAMPLE_ID=MMETSP1338 /ASSEMBLY_ACC=CAM_ASM_000754 /LENGTH=534 /DNA_ID=CAMNT_0043226927 /DNA_START=50 /DNA_END=1654 /DNA_ORIENTATION=+